MKGIRLCLFSLMSLITEDFLCVTMRMEIFCCAHLGKSNLFYFLDNVIKTADEHIISGYFF